MKTRTIKISVKTTRCPRCGTDSKRHSVGTRRLREVGISSITILEVKYSKHYCTSCRKHFSLPMDHIAQPSARFTNRVRRTAIDLVVKQDMTLEKATRIMRSKYHVHVPPTTFHDWIVADLLLPL